MALSRLLGTVAVALGTGALHIATHSLFGDFSLFAEAGVYAAGLVVTFGSALLVYFLYY